jgi:hypothetical protein
VILSDSRGDPSISFSIPNRCPTKRKLECTISDMDAKGADFMSKVPKSGNTSGLQGQEIPSDSELNRGSDNLSTPYSVWATPDSKIVARKQTTSTSALHARRVVSDVRRSVRLKGKSEGLKDDACNPSRDCIYCCADPPTLSGKVIRSLGSDFCKISAKHVSDEELSKKKGGKKGAVAKQAVRTKKEVTKMLTKKS